MLQSLCCAFSLRLGALQWLAGSHRETRRARRSCCQSSVSCLHSPRPSYLAKPSLSSQVLLSRDPEEKRRRTRDLRRLPHRFETSLLPTRRNGIQPSCLRNTAYIPVHVLRIRTHACSHLRRSKHVLTSSLRRNVGWTCRCVAKGDGSILLREKKLPGWIRPVGVGVHRGGVEGTQGRFVSLE